MERINLAQERTGEDPSTGQERKEKKRVPRERTEKRKAPTSTREKRK